MAITTTTDEIRERYRFACEHHDWRMSWFWGRWLFSRRWGTPVSLVFGAIVGGGGWVLLQNFWLR